MEPNELNSSARPDARLEAQLRALAPAPLADDGFSTRVLSALPPASALPAAPGRQRLAFAAVGGGAGLVLVLVQGGSWAEVSTRFDTLRPELAQSFATLSTPAFGLAVGLTVASLAYVYWREFRQILPRFW